MKARVRIRGIRQSADRIEALSRAGGEAMVSGLRVIGETIATDVRASRPGAGIPKDTGALAATVKVEGPTKDAGREKVTLAAGGAAEPYALTQHERLDYRHTLGEARYFVRGMERWVAGGSAEDALREMMDAAVEGGR